MDGKKKLEELVAGLDGVTPGPWQTLGGTVSDFDREWPGSLSMEFIPNGIGEDGVNERHEKDIAHIARCDPDTIRSISDAYKAMEAENERLRELLTPFAYGDIDVSGTAVIIGYSEASNAIRAARDFLSEVSRHEG